MLCLMKKGMLFLFVGVCLTFSGVSALAQDVPALHNHFFWDDPHVFYMHVHGMGKAADLARRVKPALDLIGHVKLEASAAASSGGTPLGTAKLAKIAGRSEEQTGAV